MPGPCRSGLSRDVVLLSVCTQRCVYDVSAVAETLDTNAEANEIGCGVLHTHNVQAVLAGEAK